MGVEAAYQILRATPTSTWSAIEQTRREIVQRAFPAAIAALSLEKQTVIKADASKANAAYAVLRQVRQ